VVVKDEIIIQLFAVFLTVVLQSGTRGPEPPSCNQVWLKRPPTPLPLSAAFTGWYCQLQM